jgi:CubicO group peptidase (beta-lactamase class C family)
MKNFISISLFIFFLFSSPLVKGQTGIYVPELTIFDTRMLELLNDYQIPGGQLAISYEGRLVYDRGFGYSNTATQHHVQPNSIFRLASVSKSITSVAIMYLFENGLLELDDKVFGMGGILNDAIYQSAIDPRYYNITVRQLLNHSAGFIFVYPTDPLFQTYNIAIAMGVTPPTDSIELVIDWTLHNVMLSYTPGTSASYCNFVYAILGKVIEKITSQDYEDFVRNTILLPIDITNMHAGHTLLEDTLPGEVTYYDYPGAPLMTSIYTGIPNSVPAQYGGYNWEIMTPAGGWVASAHDLCRLLVAVDRFPTRPDILLPTTIDIMTQPSNNWPQYALGWNVTGDDYWNAGGIQGTATVIKRNKSHQLNWAILFNSLPMNYTPFYYAFMDLVTDEFTNIETWPTHDLFDSVSVSGINVSCFVQMEGPFNGTNMNTHLNATGLIPLQQPFIISPWNYIGTESVVSIPNTNIVDWVLIELRDAVSPAEALPSTAISRQAAFLLNDGRVVGLDGNSILNFDATHSQNLYLIVWHRNHLGIMSNYAMEQSNGLFKYDFSFNGQAYEMGQKDLGNNIYGMYAGDLNADGMIDESDHNLWIIQAGKSAYQNEDVNLDTQIDNKDKNEFMLNNQEIFSMVPE